MDWLENMLLGLIWQEKLEPSRRALLLSKIAEFILDTIYYIDWGVRRPVCWFVGHEEKMGDWRLLEPDWCARCYCDYPSEKTTLPLLLNQGFCWMIEHCPLFSCLDEWFLAHYQGWLPSWWEY